jgi:hypothetical protein
VEEKTKNIIAKNAIERADVRISLELWQYLPVIDSLCETLSKNDMKRHTMLMALLDDIALDAWRAGVRHEQERSCYAEESSQTES